MGLKAPLKAGDSVSLTLRFDKAGPVRVVADVLKPSSMGPMMDHQH
jgi:copper(I)-binding protein